MRKTRFPIFWFTLLIACFWLFVMPVANAYVDPGTGSYVFQVLIGVFLGAAVAVKVFWKRIWGFITRKPARTSSPTAGPDKQD